MLHGNYYEQRLGSGITLGMATWMRQEDPQAVLFLNDYDILTGGRSRTTSPKFGSSSTRVCPRRHRCPGASAWGLVRCRRAPERAGSAGRVQAARSGHGVQFPRSTSKYVWKARGRFIRRRGTGQSQSPDRLLPHLFRSSRGGGHPDVGILGGSQLDPGVFALSTGLVPYPRCHRLPGPDFQTMVDLLAGPGGRARPLRESAPFSASTGSRLAAKKSWST